MEHSKKTTREEYQKCVNAVVDYINLHLGEEIDLKSLAKISHFSPFYFHRIMKAFLGEPIGTFIVRTRTEAAARLLRYSDLPITDIAYRIGYSSPSSLSKVFKQFYGIFSAFSLVIKMWIGKLGKKNDDGADANAEPAPAAAPAPAAVPAETEKGGDAK